VKAILDQFDRVVEFANLGDFLEQIHTEAFVHGIAFECLIAVRGS
jgi:hypothetical protein